MGTEIFLKMIEVAAKIGARYPRRYGVIWANRGYYPEICKFDTRLDAVKFAIRAFKHGVDFIRIDEFEI